MGVKRSHRDSSSSTEDPSTFSREQSADVKLVHLDSESAASAPPAVMKCLLPPHEPVAFASFEEYDVHYQKTHMNRCSECQKNFPDEHILHLHIAENHDPFNAARRERGEQTYACLVSTCERLCSTAPKRRMHCIDKHQFPKNYDFFIINDGIDRRNSMLRQTHRRRSSTMNSMPSEPRAQSSAGATAEAMDVVQPDETEQVDSQQQRERRSSHVKLRGRGGFSHPQGRGHQAVQNSATLSADPVDKLASSMSALHFIPHSVRMTRGTGRGRGG
ncbi:hypothetical protein C7974DRAFT_430321 [Boeremia exigua]|uniref:uncharacterized protein n=1 Tax=Boeremia exigua TaxID=749465 RepID=UPI001E8D4719|nr:uncharacterized protein C7974DRAFT_430321 [Boeremia exigua]KAH6644558.1 hypothetical protein C7974DRAFT_430321 [Boeremia exigua]